MITTQEVNSGTLLFLPLCPSTNRRTQPVRRGRLVREILTKEARDYIKNVGTALFYWSRARGWKAIDTYTTVELWFVLPRVTCDASNYGKILFDTLQSGRIFADDRFILPHYRGVWHDSKRPEVIVKI